MGKKSRFQRVERSVPQVSFTLPDVYGDAEFILPSNNVVPNKVVREVRASNFDALFNWFKQMKVDQETLDALDDLTMEEFMTFVETWGNKGTPLPKSSD